MLISNKRVSFGACGLVMLSRYVQNGHLMIHIFTRKTMWSGVFWSFDLVILLASLYESISLFTIQSLQIDIIITGTCASLYSYNLALVLLLPIQSQFASTCASYLNSNTIARTCTVYMIECKHNLQHNTSSIPCPSTNAENGSASSLLKVIW